MTITRLSLDAISVDMYGLPSALNYYYYNPNIPDQGFSDKDYLTICPAIQSIQYVPFIDTEDLDLHCSPYDKERFGEGQVIDIKDCNVYRIISLNNVYKTLGSFKCYNISKNIGGKLDYKNESRLYNYPFSFAMLTDNLNNPIEIKYHLCKNNDNNIMVINTISNTCSYGIYVEGYKGDSNGSMEALVSSDGHELPCSSSSYNQWFASNKNQMAQNLLNTSQNSFLTKQTNSKGLITGMIGAMSNTSLNPISLIGAGANMADSYFNYEAVNKRADLDVQQAIKSQLAQTNDMISTPNTMLSMGSNVYYGLQKGNKKLTLYRFTLHEEQLEKIGNYFAMFGYKQNKILIPNIRNRYYYNYIKTVDANLKSNNIPRHHFEQLKAIFDKGVTVWHIDREGVVVGDISRDNYEI